MSSHLRTMFLTAATIALTQTSAVQASELKIAITNVVPGQGWVMVALFDTPETLANRARLAGQRLAPTGDILTASFAGLAAGRYVVAVFQDLDSDGRLDSGDMGVPTEPYGFSNNVPGRPGWPEFEELAVILRPDAVTETRIDLVQ